MKINKMFLYAAAFMLAAACGKEPVTPEGGNEGEVVTPAPEYAVSFTAYTENASDSKATIGTNTSGNLQTFWEDADEISVYSSNYAVDGNTRQSYKFTTALTENSSSATFGYVGEEEFVEGNYFAVYPYKEEKRAVNFASFAMAGVEVPETQTLVAGGFDRSAMIMTAYSENLDKLHFKNAMALVKFKVADTDVISGKIVTTDKVSGIFRADLSSETREPEMQDYEKTTYLDVMFVAPGSAPLSVDAEYYVAVRPTALTNGFHIYLNDVLVKSYLSVESFERNKIYDLGTLSIPQVQTVTKTLTFDFSDAEAMEGWPAKADRTDMIAGSVYEHSYQLDGKSYIFLNQVPTGSTNAKFLYINGTSLYIPKCGYLGLPAIANHKLTGVEIVNGSKSAGASRKVGIVTKIAAADDGEQEYVSGGALAGMTGAKGTSVLFNLYGTDVNTVYYIRVGDDVDTAVSSIILTYEQVN